MGAYREGWAAMTQLMDSGASWSGNERNSSFVNVGDGTFVDVSSLTGLDFLDDGRAVVETDWDGDGRLDLWLRNRTGPQLRLMRNRGRGDHRFLALLLQGDGLNRDAIGARVEVRFGERRTTRTLRAGTGYLAQSSKWLNFGLGQTESDTAEAHVVWPNGERSVYSGLGVDGWYRLEQGMTEAAPHERSAVSLARGSIETRRPGSARVILRTPMPIPPDIWRALFGEPGAPEDAGPAWIQLWAQWCAPCLVEMDALAERFDELTAKRLRIAAVTLDEPEDLERARRVFDERVGSRVNKERFRYVEPDEQVRTFLRLLLKHVLAHTDEGALPTGLLIDKYGYVELLVVGPADVGTLLEDLDTFGERQGIEVRAPYPGRWFYGVPRDLSGFAGELAREGCVGAASFYTRFAEQAALRQRRGR